MLQPRKWPQQRTQRSSSFLVCVLVVVLSFIPSSTPNKTNNGSNNSTSSQLAVGRAINLFSRYGYLSISMRVVPRNDAEVWLFREPTVDVFQNVVADEHVKRRANGRARAVVFDGDFHMEFCDNVRQLLHAYFRDFSIEKLSKPWRAFTGSWSSAAAARELGINASFVSPQSPHSFILVRVARWRDSGRMAAPVRTPASVDNKQGANPMPAVAREIDSIKIGDEASVVNFVRSYGSHYVSSYVTGNALYQVFVYTPSVYKRIKERLRAKGVGELTSFELGGYFSPWHAVQMGRIQAASGNRTVQTWAERNLQTTFYLYSYPSLLALYGNAEKLKALDKLLLNEAVLQLELKTLAPIFKESEKRKWFEATLDNYLKLWEVNM